MENVQHETEQESDEDCEVYFLKPVNEYNIVDKIKEANKELFGNELVDDNELMAEAQQNRKVSFAANLEEYEPQNGINLRELEDKLGKEPEENNEENFQEIEKEQKLDVITEEEAVNEVDVNEDSEANENCETNTQDEKEEEEKEELSTIDMNDNESNDNLVEAEERPESPANCESVDENVILEEICEEILVMDMENEKIEETVTTKFDSPSAMQRKMLKQITFDYTEEDDEPDNKSLTNLLISDNENDPNENEADNEDYNCNESINEDTDNDETIPLNHNEYYEDDEEDDKLSIIVASYLPDDMACDKTSLTASSRKCSPRTNKSRKLPFNKRFSFRHKTKSSNAIGSCSNHHSSNNRRFMPPPEVTDLKLHYKTCCEFKNAQQKLPNYTGYLSEYGLSKEQLIERDRKLQQKQQGKEVNSLRSTEADMRKMHDNERAFTTWLKNKMRFPINKTRNMFDVKRPFGLRKSTSVGGNNTLNEDTKQMLNTTKYRSISAKLKRA
ncbi:myb-like protein X [Lucilia sericata]|uniref:myb-like protein X n=1 Tax=Lucilia sericata TaxID=13632 RepID=UPI0018A853C0|nr:myb-like protein X [Lucilia sericata]